jgi:hypothetical protein
MIQSLVSQQRCSVVVKDRILNIPARIAEQLSVTWKTEVGNTIENSTRMEMKFCPSSILRYVA